MGLKSISVSLFVSLFISVAFAEKVPWKAGDGPGPSGTSTSKVIYADKKATIPWSENEGISPSGVRSGLWDECRAINDFIGTVINCSYDKASAQAYYNKVATWKAPLRSQVSSPAEMLVNSLKCFTEGSAAMSSVVYNYLKHEEADPKKKALKEFQSKVKDVKIVFILDNKKPSVALNGTTLVLNVRSGLKVGNAEVLDDSGINGCGWISNDVFRIFPALHANYQEYH